MALYSKVRQDIDNQYCLEVYGLPEQLTNFLQPRSTTAYMVYIGRVNKPIFVMAVAFSVQTLQELTFLAKLLSPLVLKLPEVCTVSIFIHTLAPTCFESFVLRSSGVST